MRRSSFPWRAWALAASLLAAGLWLPPATAQPAASAPVAEAPGGLSRDLPLKREPAGAAEGPPWFALVVLLGLAGAAAVFVLRRRGASGLLQAWQGPRAAGSPERLGSQALTPHASVHAVRWQGEELLLGCTSTQVTVLARRSVGGAGVQES